MITYNDNKDVSDINIDAEPTGTNIEILNQDSTNNLNSEDVEIYESLENREMFELSDEESDSEDANDNEDFDNYLQV
ncbi:5351_t:CDS:2 [Cetraspora pellucida]|uniref:5351_t:CDS:1 n=1 Tax=Cetraspora pellucida TaxID=1433469 RepID=A0ACA9L3A8_9GLOM|nr:5351_t:CDS:2 [Cetraspora pellucida]